MNTTITSSLSVGHAWTTTTTDTQQVTETIKPKEVGWLNSIPSTETVTGEATMTGNSSQPIAFQNVSYSEPGVNQYNDPARNFTCAARPGPARLGIRAEPLRRPDEPSFVQTVVCVSLAARRCS